MVARNTEEVQRIRSTWTGLAKTSYKTERGLVCGHQFLEKSEPSVFNRLTEGKARREKEKARRVQKLSWSRAAKVKVENKKKDTWVRHEGGVVI